MPFKYLDRYTGGEEETKELLRCGYKENEKVDLGLDPSEMEYFKQNGMDQDEDDGHKKDAYKLDKYLDKEGL